MLQLVPLVILALVSGYAPAAGGLNCDGNCAVTASGLPPGPTLAACGYGWDLGQRLQVPGYGAVACGDRFASRAYAARAGLPSYAVDLWFATAAEAYAWGVRRLPVTVLSG